ncbi:MAG: ATP-binding cassette domain-containing protein [Acidobacteriota bacterium]|nr:ATP-binding cassette domain-containing protein [Acidobacteriota bacterium]
MTTPDTTKQLQDAPVARPRSQTAGRPKIVPAIEFRNVHLSFDESKILRGLSFTVRPGEMKIVLGGSGTGKSTVLKLILGLLKPDRGRILIDGKDITAYSEARLMRVRMKIGMVFQEGALFDSLSVYDNVAYRLHERGVAESQVEKQVRRMLRFVELEDAIDLMPDELSGGMRRRVGIARALVGNPRILLFDEPTAGLDPPTSHVVSQLAIQLRDVRKASSIFVTHRIHIVKHLSERGADDAVSKTDEGLHLPNTTIIMLREGQAIFDGTYDELQSSTDSYIRRFIRGR